MSLLHPTTGEMLDRFALLTLKIQYGIAAGKDMSHFNAERKEIAAALGKIEDVARPLAELLRIHAEMWPLIETSPPELLRLNARRAAIREEIDRATGEYRGPEKV